MVIEMGREVFQNGQVFSLDEIAYQLRTVGMRHTGSAHRDRALAQMQSQLFLLQIDRNLSAPQLSGYDQIMSSHMPK